MPFNECSYEQTDVMREALETVVRDTVGGEYRREEIAKIVLRIASEITLDATALANLTRAEMSDAARKNGLVSNYSVIVQQRHAVLGL
jgi:hypothetical protein